MVLTLAERETGFRSGGTPGGRWGCGAAAAVFLFCLPIAGMLMMGDGGPPGAHNRAMWQVLGIALFAAAAFGFTARWLINLTLPHNGEGRAPLWVLGLLAAVFASMVWRIYSWTFGA